MANNKIIFDIEGRIKEWLDQHSKLGLEETGKGIGEATKEAKKIEPEKVKPAPVEQERPKEQPHSKPITTSDLKQSLRPPESPQRKTKNYEAFLT